jgi:hypothetical protein
MLKFFNEDCINYGQVIKDKEMQRVIGSHKRLVFGNIPRNEISIAHIDGFCKALRERGKCFVREASTYAKKRKTIWNLLATYQAYNNLINAKRGETPCMKEGITNSIWSWGKLLNAKISVVS